MSGRSATSESAESASRQNGYPPDAPHVRLECREIRVAFAGVHAIDGVDLQLERGEIMGLIGTNGAGKTTLVNVVSGYQRPTGGSVLLGDRDVTRWSPRRMAGVGVVRTFQAGRVFANLSVAENVEAAIVGVGRGRREARSRARELLAEAGMLSRSALHASALPHGEVRVLGIVRALSTRPKFMLVDEPAAGSNEAESERLMGLLSRIARVYSIGLLVIEHDMSLIMRLCDRIQVLDHGKTIAVGSPAAVRSDPAVIRAYLGTDGGGTDAPLD